MKKISREEVLPLGDYERIRDRFRQRVIEAKKSRRVRISEDISLLFENRDTVLLQIQEMLRTERITQTKAIQHEIDTYNELVPLDLELSATLFIEIPEQKRRDEMLQSLKNIEAHISMCIGESVFRATYESGRSTEEKAAAVQYIKFPIDEKAMSFLKSTKSDVFIEFDHPNFSKKTQLTPLTIQSLAEDFD